MECSWEKTCCGNDTRHILKTAAGEVDYHVHFEELKSCVSREIEGAFSVSGKSLGQWEMGR